MYPPLKSAQAGSIGKVIKPKRFGNVADENVRGIRNRFFLSVFMSIIQVSCFLGEMGAMPPYGLRPRRIPFVHHTLMYYQQKPLCGTRDFDCCCIDVNTRENRALHARDGLVTRSKSASTL